MSDVVVVTDGKDRHGRPAIGIPVELFRQMCQEKEPQDGTRVQVGHRVWVLDGMIDFGRCYWLITPDSYADNAKEGRISAGSVARAIGG